MLERRGVGASRDLAANGEGALRRAAAEARRPPPPAASDRLPNPDWRRPSRTRPRPSTVGELTAALPRLSPGRGGAYSEGPKRATLERRAAAPVPPMKGTTSEPKVTRRRI